MRRIILCALCVFAVSLSGWAASFRVVEATIDDIQAAYKSGQLTCRQLVQMYLERIEAYDKKGPKINSIITVNPKALEEADRLDAAFRASGFVGPLHGIPVILKDQVDTQGMPTTLGSILFKDFRPDKDAVVVEKLKKAGAVILAKATLAEFVAGDTYGSLFGFTRNPYGLDRTVGGSSGGTGGSIAASFATVGVGQESVASLRRPSAWNSLAGIRTSMGLISRSGVYGGWPGAVGELGPMARTVKDMAILLDVLVGYDAEDPITALTLDHVPDSYTKFLDKNALKGARLGVIRESFGINSEPGSEDFNKVSEVFEQSLKELKAAGAILVDPVAIPQMKELMAKRGGGGEGNEAWLRYFGRSAKPPYQSQQELVNSPDFAKLSPTAQRRMKPASAPAGAANPSQAALRHYEYLVAREKLMLNLLNLMADLKLDAIIHKSVEHQPTRLSEDMLPAESNETKGVPALNTFLQYVPTITVPAGFTRDNLPVGISFLGRPFSEGQMIRLAYAYEQATHHRKPPATTPPLQSEK